MFGLGKKKKAESECCCGGDCVRAEEANVKEEQAQSEAPIKVLGGCCDKCHELEVNVRAALAELGRDDAVELVTDFAVIASYGVMTTPALVIDGKVVSYQKVLSKNEIIGMLEN